MDSFFLIHTCFVCVCVCVSVHYQSINKDVYVNYRIGRISYIAYNDAHRIYFASREKRDIYKNLNEVYLYMRKDCEILYTFLSHAFLFVKKFNELSV